MANNCGQINIPTVDNSSPCGEFIISECVIVNRKSNLIKNIKDHDLNEYLTLLENKIKVMDLHIKKIDKIIKYITVNLPEIGIGIYEED